MPENVLLPGGGWRLWNQFSLRGPGFPAAGVLRLAPEGLALAADKFGEKLSGGEWDEFEEFFGSSAVETALALQEIAALPRFRAAVAWQNRAVLSTGIAPFLSWTPSVAGRTSMPRQREELVAHYWQRFCVKNDTIGFFGPVGWGTLDPARQGVAVDVGSGLIAESEVYFASWGIDALAKIIGADPALRQWIPPRRVAFARAVDGTLRLPSRPPQEMSPFAQQIFPLCDGARQPWAIAKAVGRPVQDVLGELADMVQRRWIVWRIEIPATTHPDQHLRATLERVGDPAVRRRALDKLEVLERGRERVRSVTDDADALVDALTALEAEFTELTQAAAHKDKGARTSACRALVYSDSRRSATASVGADILDELTPLTLCLTAARWMTNRYAEVTARNLRTAYERLREQQGTVDMASLWMECLPAPYADSIEDIERIQAELREHWTRIINAPAGARRVQLSSSDIIDQVRETFEEPGDGWNLSRYVSPDVIIVADSTEAVQRGDFQLLIGELHVALNTIGASLFVMQHPHAQSLMDETSIDFPGPRVMPMLPKEQAPRWSTRSRPCLVQAEDYYVGMVDYTADAHRPRTLMAADVTVEDRDGRLMVVLPDGSVFNLLDVYGNALTKRVMDRFTLRSEGEHSPRVTVDKMVVARETWRFVADDMDFTAEKSEARRFVRARQWRETHELPRFVFVVSPTEPRPFYVDFDSPVYVNIFAKAARRLARKDPTARVTITEMLPNPEQTWLTDDKGAKYTSELRFVAVDQTTVDHDSGDRTVGLP